MIKSCLDNFSRGGGIIMMSSTFGSKLLEINLKTGECKCLKELFVYC